MIIWVQLLEGQPQQNLGGKNVQKIPHDFGIFQLWLQISPEWIDILKIWKARNNNNLSHTGVHVDPPKWLWETTFRPLGVLAPQIFTLLETDQGLAHTPVGQGLPMVNI